MRNTNSERRRGRRMNTNELFEKESRYKDSILEIRVAFCVHPPET